MVEIFVIKNIKNYKIFDNLTGILIRAINLGIKKIVNKYKRNLFNSFWNSLIGKQLKIFNEFKAGRNLVYFSYIQGFKRVLIKGNGLQFY